MCASDLYFALSRSDHGALYNLDNRATRKGLLSCFSGGYGNFDNWCENYFLAIWLASSVPSITGLASVLLLCMRLSLTPEMEQAIVMRVTSLEKQNHFTQAILQRGELYAAEVLDPRRLKPVTYQLSIWLTLLIRYVRATRLERKRSNAWSLIIHVFGSLAS